MMTFLHILPALLLLALQIYLTVGFCYMVRYSLNNHPASWKYVKESLHIFFLWPEKRK